MFYSLAEYDAFGDLQAIQQYYQARGERYDISPEVHRTTKHFLHLHAMNLKDFTRFESYVQAFPTYIKGSLRRDFWVNRFARFYLQNERPAEALELYQIGLKQFPESALLYNGLGDCYQILEKEAQPYKLINKR